MRRANAWPDEQCLPSKLNLFSVWLLPLLFSLQLVEQGLLPADLS